MPKFHIIGTITGGAFLGEIDAESAEAAQKEAEDEYLGTNTSLCHRCSDKISDPTISAVEAQAVED